MNTTRKLSALFLSLALLVGLLPQLALFAAAEPGDQLPADTPAASFGGIVSPEESEIWDGSVAASFDSGTGTEADPYIIWCAVPIALIPAAYGFIVYFISLIIRVIHKPRI